jgi:hypothetical protein
MTEEDKTYNGWTNYATWRIKLEMFDSCEQFEDFEEVTADELEEQCEEAISQYGELNTNSLAYNYAMAFISEVNFYEIAKSLNRDLKEMREYKAKQD